MGVDTQALIHSKWKPAEIEQVFADITNGEVFLHHTHAPDYYQLVVKLRTSRTINIFQSSETPIGIATQLSMSFSDESVELLTLLLERHMGKEQLRV